MVHLTDSFGILCHSPSPACMLASGETHLKWQIPPQALFPRLEVTPLVPSVKQGRSQWKVAQLLLQVGSSERHFIFFSEILEELNRVVCGSDPNVLPYLGFSYFPGSPHKQYVPKSLSQALLFGEIQTKTVKRKILFLTEFISLFPFPRSYSFLLFWSKY